MAKYKVADMVQALRESKGMVYVTARKLGCSPTTVYNYAAKHPSVQEAIDSERGLMVDTGELALWKALQNGEAWAVSLVLKTLGKSRGYVERVETTGADGDPVQTQAEVSIDLSGLSTEQLEALAASLKD